MNHFTIIIPSYNNINWIDQCIDSAVYQRYNNFDVIFIDADSNDGSYELVKNKYSKIENLKIIRNVERRYNVENFIIGINMAKDGSIIVNLDGDDWLKNYNVLNVLNNNYNDDVWMTYGSYENEDGSKGIIGGYNDQIIENNDFRKSGWHASHLRTYRKELFLSIRDEDLRDSNGNYYSITGDLAIMFPMLEMSGFKSKYITDILYVYNRKNPLSDSNNRELQCKVETEIRSKSSYEKIKNLK